MFTTYNFLNDINEIRSLFNNFFTEKPSWSGIDYPYVNLYEKDDKIDIVVTAPGAKAENFNIELVDGRLIIELDKNEENENNNYIRTERRFGKFRKSIQLPYKVDADKIEAKMTDGILHVSLQKSPEAKPKKIAIN